MKDEDQANIIDLYYFDESGFTGGIVTACFDAFSRYITKRTIVVLDNAPIHHSAIFKSQIGTWEERGLFLYFIPKYSPELNLIEILWKHIKYFWLSNICL